LTNRNVVSALVASAMLVGYVFGGWRVEAQGALLPLQIGQRIWLGYEAGERGPCDVAAVSGDFVLCKDQQDNRFVRRPHPDEWYNLRVVRYVTTPARE
jgi:hypothetical protein